MGLEGSAYGDAEVVGGEVAGGGIEIRGGVGVVGGEGGGTAAAGGGGGVVGEERKTVGGGGGREEEVVIGEVEKVVNAKQVLRRCSLSVHVHRSGSNPKTQTASKERERERRGFGGVVKGGLVEIQGGMR